MIKLSEIYEHSFSATMEDTRHAVSGILSFISDNSSASDYILYDLKLIFSELLFNAAIHGNKLDKSKLVYVSIELSGDELYTIIRDEGEGYDTSRLVKKVSNEPNLSGEHGRGVRLVLSMTDELSFNERGNEIRFRKKLVVK